MSAYAQDAERLDEVPEVPGPSTSAAEADAEITAAEEDEDTPEDEQSLTEEKGLRAIELVI